MRHMQHLLTMRRSGARPAHVRLTDQRGPLGDAWWQHPELHRFAELEIEPSDSPPVADLRALVGLPVLVDVTDPERCMRWAEAAVAAGAKPVIALNQPQESF
jgi:hypothetical protein